MYICFHLSWGRKQQSTRFNVVSKLLTENELIPAVRKVFMIFKMTLSIESFCLYEHTQEISYIAFSLGVVQITSPILKLDFEDDGC